MGLCLTLHTTAKGNFHTMSQSRSPSPQANSFRCLLQWQSGRAACSSSPGVTTAWLSGFRSCGYYNQEPQAQRLKTQNCYPSALGAKSLRETECIDRSSRALCRPLAHLDLWPHITLTSASTVPNSSFCHGPSCFSIIETLMLAWSHQIVQEPRSLQDDC